MLKVLVVDDSFFMRLIIRDIMHKMGHTIIGEASLELLRELQAFKEFIREFYTSVGQVGTLRQIKDIGYNWYNGFTVVGENDAYDWEVAFPDFRPEPQTYYGRYRSNEDLAMWTNPTLGYLP